MAPAPVKVRSTQPRDFKAIERLSRLVYPNDFPWTPDYISTHLAHFPEGQLVAVDATSDEVIGMCASLVVTWDDCAQIETYLDFTGEGYFRNHDPSGRTLYGAEVMVDPNRRGEGIGSALYRARKQMVRRLGLQRIRAHARLPGYHAHAGKRTAEEYVRKVVAGEITDPTLSFQLRHDFSVLGIVSDYFARDPRSRGYAALIEWVNEEAPSAIAKDASAIGKPSSAIAKDAPANGTKPLVSAGPAAEE